MATEWQEIREGLVSPNTYRIQREGITQLMDTLRNSLNARNSSSNSNSLSSSLNSNTSLAINNFNANNFIRNSSGSNNNRNIAISDSANTTTCPRCKVTEVVRPGSRQRLMCRFCGSLFHPDRVQNRMRHTEIRDSPHPRFGSIGSAVLNRLGNFFTSIDGRRGSNDSTTSEPDNTNTRGKNRRNKSSESRGNTSSDQRLSSRYSRSHELMPTLFGSYRMGSGSSLPPIRHSQDVSSVSKGDGGREKRSARSEERGGSTGASGGSAGGGVDPSREAQMHRPAYPARHTQRHEFIKEVQKAKSTKNYNEMKKFYFETFEAFANICATFKRDPEMDGALVEDTGINMELLHTVYDSLKDMPSLIHKHFLKGVINSLLQERPHLFSKDNVRALFVIIQSPVFLSQSSYSILAYVLRAITDLHNGDHQLLVQWFKTMEVSRFRLVIGFIIQFLTVRQFPPPDRSLPPLNTSKWWIPTATRVLAILYASNSAAKPPLLHYTEFYNHTLDHMELMTEYRKWQIPDRSDTFSYCQYPFILSIIAKRLILTKDAEQQMILSARRSLVARVANQQPPQIDVFFLNINVRRNKLVDDSLKEIGEKKSDLKKKLRVTFEGEPGLDMGGLTKEWFLLLTKQIFEAENRMFVYHQNDRLHWFSTGPEGSLREYNLIGVLMGLAVYNSIILDIRFPSICFKKLLSPPVVPKYDHIPVGIVRDPTLHDLAEIMPEVAQSLENVLKYEGNVEEDMCLTFQISIEEFGETRTFNLRENAEEVPITNDNRQEFVNAFVDWILNTAIYDKFRAFYLGFHTVTASNALIMLRPEEVEMLVCGSPNLDLNELKKVTEYDNYTVEHPTIQWFWQVLSEMSLQEQKQFLLFSTGSDRIPVGGMGEMTFKISCWRGHCHMLPQAHTCFNQLVLPPYDSKGELYHKLTIAISNAEGFGLE